MNKEKLDWTHLVLGIWAIFYLCLIIYFFYSIGFVDAIICMLAGFYAHSLLKELYNMYKKLIN